MKASDIPTKFQIPFANSAGGSFIRPIPVASQIGIQNGAASLTTGFPPDTFISLVAGGTPPFGADFNGLLNQSTAWDRWYSAGGPLKYDSVFSAVIGGYAQGAVVASNVLLGKLWLSLVDDNTTDPDSTSSANWVTPPGMADTGDVGWRATAESRYGWVKANAQTIGNASSNATALADASTWPLFNWHWTNFSNTQCPVLTSGGVATTRGANAAADFAANKQITVLDMRGTGAFGVDNMGGAPSTRLAGVPVTSGTTIAPGSVLGENLHTLTTPELAAHSHANSLNDPQHLHPMPGDFSATVQAGTGKTALISGGNTQTVAAATGLTITNASAGGGGSHNTVERNMLGTWYLKL